MIRLWKLCRERLIDKLVKECSENVDKKKLYSNDMIYNGTLNDHKMYAILVQYTHIFVLSITISSVFFYFYWYIKKSNAE